MAVGENRTVWLWSTVQVHLQPLKACLIRRQEQAHQQGQEGRKEEDVSAAAAMRSAHGLLLLAQVHAHLPQHNLVCFLQR
jgi:hypothetical protein